MDNKNDYQYPSINHQRLPFWVKWNFISERTKCRIGLHVPVRVSDIKGNTIDVVCQNCSKKMTIKQWKRFFRYV